MGASTGQDDAAIRNETAVAIWQDLGDGMSHPGHSRWETSPGKDSVRSRSGTAHPLTPTSVAPAGHRPRPRTVALSLRAAVQAEESKTVCPVPRDVIPH
jgi:hypothetical protein